MFPYALSIGNGGWVRWELLEPPVFSGFMRLERTEERFAVAALYLPKVPSVRDLGRVPIAAIEARVNDDAQIRSAVERMLDHPAPLLDVAVSYYTQTSYVADGQVIGAGGWVGEMLRSQTPRHGVEPVEPATMPPLIRADEREFDATLDIPAGRPYGDEFYRRVAEVYSALAIRHRDPNQRIADANELGPTGVKRVEQWVRKGRALGYLPPARHGKRG